MAINLKRKRNSIIVLCGMLLLAACHDNTMYMKYKSVDAREWHAHDTLVYKLPEIENDMNVSVTVGVRTLQSFKYDNLAVVAKLYEGKHLISQDTVNYIILDKNGENIGTGFPYAEHFRNISHRYALKAKKKYKIKLTHIMRLDPLDGVSDVGITIESSDFVPHPFSGK